MNRKQLDVINYLHTENQILKEQLEQKGIKLGLNNTQRRKLARAGKKLVKFERLGGLLSYYHRENGKEVLKIA